MVLRSFAATMVVLSIGGCVQREYLAANPAGDGTPASETRYTANASYVTSVEVIPLRFDSAFSPEERREMMRAVAEWNHVLNGYVRFDASITAFHSAPLPGDAGLPRADSAPLRKYDWSILLARGAAPIGLHIARPMALSQPTPHGGGVVMIFREQATEATLAAVMRHELGLLDDSGNRLMSPVHDPAAQQCIDKPAVAAVAEQRGLPLALNWCEEVTRG